jgi:hypothetical protein
LLESNDGGESFTKIPDSAPVATAAFKFEVGEGQPRGFFNPTNMIEKDGYKFLIMYTNGGESQKRGSCLFRSAKIDDHNAWEYWTGKEFVKSSFDPYTSSEAPPPPCQPLSGLDGRIWTITRHVPTGLYVAAMGMQGPNQASGAAGLIFSKDLISWFGLTKLFDTPMLWSRTCDNTLRVGYLSLLDLTAKDRNFSELRDQPYLYFTELPVAQCRTSFHRDLVRYRLNFSELRSQ